MLSALLEVLQDVISALRAEGEKVSKLSRDVQQP